MTYFGQFIDHDITLELASADLTKLTSPSLAPLPVDKIRHNLRNARTATLDLDSVYDLPAPRDGDKMLLGKVSPTGTRHPLQTTEGERRLHDLPRNPRSGDPATDRAATIGDPRNDENTTSRNCMSPSCALTTRSSTSGTPSRRHAASYASTTSMSSSTTT